MCQIDAFRLAQSESKWRRSNRPIRSNNPLHDASVDAQLCADLEDTLPLGSQLLCCVYRRLPSTAA